MCGRNHIWIALYLFIGTGFLHSTRAASLRCYTNGSINSYVTAPLEKPLGILNTTCIDNTLPTVVYTFGFRGRSAGPATTAVLSEYLKTRKRNVLLVDWEEEAKSGVLGIPLGYALNAVPNAKKVGTKLGGALVRLARSGLNMTRVHLVGHSLGAHIMGFAGRTARANGFLVPRITGLDPARALFEGTLAIQSGLDRKCGRFVDIIHTDPGGYGTSKPGGTVDLWPNYAGSGATQPGCPLGDYDMFSREDLCSHDRSWQFFVEAIRSPTMFPAREAADHEDWLSRADHASRTIYMGELTNTRALGNFFLTTNPTAPFGRGDKGLEADGNQVRRKRTSSALSRLLKYLR